MHEICAEARMSPGAVYRYFPAKDDIIEALVREWAEGELAALRQHVKGSFMDRLEQAAGRLLERFLGADGALAAEMIAESARNERVHLALTRAQAQRLKLFTAGLERAQQAGDVDPALNCATAARITCAAIDGLGVDLALRRAANAAAARRVFRVFAQRYLGVLH